MDSTILSPIRPGIVGVQTAPRPTAPPVRVPFSEVLSVSARALVNGAQSVLRALPGSPLIAVALRGGSASVPSFTTPSSVFGGTLPIGATAGLQPAAGNPEGPGGASAAAGVLGPVATSGSAVATGGAAASGSDGSMEGTLAQEQQMSLYYLQIQEEVNAQNRSFSALSNVLEVEHNTAKTAIGNIH
jgi:hypothetical protein